MVSKKNNIIIATIIAVFSFFVITYMSCNKPNKDMTVCKNVVCRNGGHCNDSSKCVCPVGYEDSVCGTQTVLKYFSNWGVIQKITGSDSTQYIYVDSLKNDTLYTLTLKASATPTTFLIANFNNNPYYSNVICTLDSMNSLHFTIDTISPFQMVYYSYQILTGSGTMNKTKDTINANFITRHKNHTTNWEVDTVNMLMTRHNY